MGAKINKFLPGCTDCNTGDCLAQDVGSFAFPFAFDRKRPSPPVRPDATSPDGSDCSFSKAAIITSFHPCAETASSVDTETTADVCPFPLEIQEEYVEEWPGLGRLQPDTIDFSELTQGCGTSRREPNQEIRGVSIRKLLLMLEFIKRRCDGRGAIRGWHDPKSNQQLFYQTISLRHLVHWVVKPITRTAQRSLAEVLHAEGPCKAPHMFVGHWWGESFLDFVGRVRKHSNMVGSGKDYSYWTPVFCTRLHDISGLILNSNSPGMNICAINDVKSFKVHFSGEIGSPVTINELGQGLSTLHALHTLELNCARCSNLVAGSTLGLGIKALRCLTSLDLNFSGANAISQFEEIGNAFSSLQALEVLRIDLSACATLNAVNLLGELVRDLPNLTDLELNLSGSTAATSVDTLGTAVGGLRGLNRLALNLSGCSGITSVGELGKGISLLNELVELKLDFRGCTKLSKIDDLAKGVCSLNGLKLLKLNLFACSGLTTITELKHGLATLLELEPPVVIEVCLAGCSGLPAGESNYKTYIEPAATLEMVRDI